MADETGITWPILPHTKAKHEILRYYLGAWFPTLASVYSRLLYVDGFAGPGEYKGGEDGSPIIALKVAGDHALKAKLTRSGMDLVFLFTEKDEARYQNLERKIAELKPQLPNAFRVETYCAGFEEVFDTVLSKIEEQNKRLAPSFVFIDPFGPTGFPMSLISRLAKQARSEILITFNYQALNKWFLQDLRKHRRVDELYGGDVWHPALQMPTSNQKESFLIEAYQKTLENLGWKGRNFRMVNKQNQTQYYLFFATTHWEGMLAMKRAMWSASSGDFQYSDLTNPQQLRLFELSSDEEYAQDLANQLYQNRKGQTTLKQGLLQNEVAWHPTCIERHLTRALIILEYESSPQEIIGVKLPNGRKRREKTYPKDCTITFAS